MHRLLLCFAVLLTLYSTSATALLIHETATMGNTGTNGGWTVSQQYLGSRFEINETYQITAVGGAFRQFF